MVNYKSVVKYLLKRYSDADQIAIISNSGKILYSTNNWDIKRDIKRFLGSWASRSAQSVDMNGIRYSVLQMDPERFIGTNRNKKGHLVGATTPNGDKSMVVHIRSRAKDWFHTAYPAVARAAALMGRGGRIELREPTPDFSKRTGGKKSFSSMNSGMSRGGTVNLMVGQQYQQPYVDPILKGEIEDFLSWINNPQGLPGYITYYLQQYDPYIISQLADIYKDLNDIINF